MAVVLKVSDSVLRKAIELKSSNCYSAMSMANALGGSPSPEWDIARGNKLVDLLAEAEHRKIDVYAIKGAVTDNPITDHPWYIEAQKLLKKLAQHGASYNGTNWILDGVILGTKVSAAIEAIDG